MTEAGAARQVGSLDEYMDASRTAPTGSIGDIVIVSDSLPERNGVGAYYADLMHLLEDEGYSATLLCPSEERPTWLRFPLPGDATQKIWIPSVFRFRRVMNDVRPKTIIAATPGPYGLLGAWWARRLGARFIVGFHTHFSGVTDVYSNRFLRFFSRFYFNIADKILFRYGDLVLANSEAMVDLAERLGAREVGIMGTLLPRESLVEPQRPLRGDLRHVMFAGRLAPEKRVQTIIDAARELPGFRFTIAGDGPLQRHVVDQAGQLPNLDYAGWISRSELITLMDDADMLVLNSVVESFGTVALEAMARGRLALVSSTCGIVDWPDLVGNLHMIGENESLPDAIRRVANLPANSRADTAMAARKAALRLNRGSLLHWLDVLQGTARGSRTKSR
jgi:glycosyltransferase involved in cell wall biosynthesis